MAAVLSLNSQKLFPSVAHSRYPDFEPCSSCSGFNRKRRLTDFAPINTQHHRRSIVYYKLNKEDSNPGNVQEPADDEVNDLGVKAAISMLKFYKSESFVL